MVRGTPGKRRENTVSVRLNDEEQARWKAGMAAAGRREMGAWVRQVVEEVLAARGDGPPAGAERRPAPLDPVSQAAYDELVRIGNNLNQLTRYTHQDAALHRGLEAVLFEVGNAALALRGIAPMDGTETAEDEMDDA
ncbi:plasmid mobilization relaxosome protein MobC [Streptomyces sp. NPDC059122]|uniref:plasmid mobilization relaxosome protein MobC n=1 Tax=Streptomyces sp. NPDC059122 TaxID=3346732 RepID=UPI0036A69D76